MLDHLRPDGAQHLVEVLGPVQDGYRDGDHAGHLAGSWACGDEPAEAPAELGDLPEEPGRASQRRRQAPRVRVDEMVIGVPVVLELALDRDPPLELGPELVPLRERLLEGGLGALGSLLGAQPVCLLGAAS